MSIRSPHVIQAFADGSTPSGIPYVVMELLDGENLATHIARCGPCTLPHGDARIPAGTAVASRRSRPPPAAARIEPISTAPGR